MPDTFGAVVACGKAVVARVVGGPRDTPDLLAYGRGDGDWDALMDIAKSHAMLPLVADVLGDVNVTGVPAQERARLSAAGRGAAVSALAATRQLADTMRVLERAGVPALAYKGPALSLAAYGNVGLRTSDDLDIVVAPDDLRRAADALADGGYVPVDRRSWTESRVAHDWQGHVALARAGEPLPVELHWRFCDRKLPWSPDVGGVIERATSVRLGDVETHVPAAADQIVLVTLHAARHGWDRLESLVCAGALVARGVDGAELIAAARRARGVRATLAGLEAVRRLFDIALPTEVVAAIGRDRRAQRIAGDVLTRLRAGDRGPARDAALHLALLDGPLARIRYFILAAALPTARDAQAIRLPAYLWPIYSPIRLLRLAWRALVHRPDSATKS
ncbi:MAG: nucleotidyltransferase family protein [Gemmatimonadetes bacterium]|nr:nucleotidyltransferase family protein [Gemmatimonadota bacterium]